MRYMTHESFLGNVGAAEQISMRDANDSGV